MLDMIEQLRKYREKDTNMDTNFLPCSQCLRQGNDSTDREGCALRYSLNMSAHATKLCLGLLVARCQCDAGVQLGRS